MIVPQVKRLRNLTIVTIAPLSLTRSKKKEKVFDCSAKKRIFAADFQKITNNDKEEISPPLVGCCGSAVVGTVVRASAAGCPEAN
jgi:hypothetical protein